MADDSHAVLCLEKRKGSKKDWLCPLSPACWARPDYVTQGCSSVQRFTRRLWNPLWQLPETKIHLRNTQLPQFLSPPTKHIGSLYIMYWHQEFQLLHMQPILVIRKSTDKGRSLCFPRFKNDTQNSPAILPFFGKWQKFTPFTIIRAGEVTSGGPLSFPGIPY